MIDGVKGARLRFAPSPTGGLHPGNARIAVFNWLFSKKYNATYILRIEDTDLERSTIEHEKGIIDDLKWLGITWDEGPFRQSERLSRYNEVCAKLLEKGWAYKCWCTDEELEAERTAQLKAGKPPRYSGKCKKDQNREGVFAIRFDVERFISEFGAKIEFIDLIRNKNEEKLSQSAKGMGDLVIMKRTQTPTYNFAVVIDDMDMNITHVFRGEDHISNTYRQIMLFKVICDVNSVECKIPLYGHLPMLLAPDRTKLGKRNGGIPIHEYKDAGYLSDAVFNHLAFLGGLYQDIAETEPRKVLVERFDPDNAAPSACIYDLAKLASVNAMFIAKKDINELRSLLIEENKLPAMATSIYGDAALKDILNVCKDGAKTLEDINHTLDIFIDTNVNKELLYSFSEEQKELFNNVKVIVSKDPKSVTGKNWMSFKTGELPTMTKLSGGKLWKTLRVMLTGKDFGPPLDDIMSHMDPKVLKDRIDNYV
jgi:glutamyl-tRNA synthetase